MAAKKQKRQPHGDYAVGYCRPPAQHQFRPGRSGNPSGQHRSGHGKATADELNDIFAAKVTMRDGDKTRKVSLLAANLLAHGTKGAKGDARSSAIFLNEARKLGWLDNQAFGDTRIGPADKVRPSEGLMRNLEPSLLSREEQAELSRLASKIDGAGDVCGLSASEFERVKELVTKGRGSNVVLFRRTEP